MKYKINPTIAAGDSLPQPSVSRRQFVMGAVSAGALIGLSGSPLSWGAANLPTLTERQTLSGKHFDLDISYQPVNFTGKSRIATAVNGSVPGRNGRRAGHELRRYQARRIF